MAGARSADLPAYRFQAPCDEQLGGYADRLRHWPWEDAPPAETTAAIVIPVTPERTTAVTHRLPSRSADLVVLSHLRWTWVWQRPQHLVSRFALGRATSGGRTWFVEEPVIGDVAAPTLATADGSEGVTRVWLVLPRTEDTGRPLGFDAPGAAGYGAALRALLDAAGVSAPDVLLYTPMALDVAEAVGPARLLYDVMDDLASFKNAPEGLRLRHRRVLTEAELVFTGGRSLHRAVTRHRPGPTILAPSGVETAHFARAARLRGPHERPTAGYVGVIDERLDLALLEGLAARLPGWTLRIVGPVAKIDEADLPQGPNLEYPGMVDYRDLPALLATFDVALMPFALNEATRSISPTKTLEYLAAGLPVVSTRVPDVVADHASRVVLVDDAEEAATACRSALLEGPEHREARMRLMSRDHEWDAIARTLAAAMDAPAAALASGSTA